MFVGHLALGDEMNKHPKGQTAESHRLPGVRCRASLLLLFAALS